ncbi:transcriptional regulator [Vibrio breoganii]|uniref:Transcriptional regulator n=1 Tax=Vibrio breoganii TaxID=553239 RepID=A0AAP8SWB8_9VIBR|nr:SgrR family transcriptional regulator [Vibrio breoganii]NMO75116.1 SgrR family transcriptional regulator [Vibrio breoganii]NMR68856.1 SgrR family transcriptional regulator [Vibrio breoganii]PMG03696.1 transcriptional regulator [Vibrio breoganii]PML91104.1 transcriptional regulator [Vibrio breoganii]PMP08410.1 transcriptional regulator [Vibrio breoganii]
MSSPRLRTQFETLFEHFNGEDSDTRIEDITEILFCTRRNARIVLNKLSEEGWIEWHPSAGRGKQSKLIFKQNRQDVGEGLAKRYLEEGRIGQALQVLNQDANRLTQVIQDYLGVQHRQGQQVLSLPYYRQLSMLNPRKPHRRSEQNIIHQVFSGLTQLDENDKLTQDLAHSWDNVEGSHWRFYLRAKVRFHNGQLLETEHVVEHLKSLANLPLFAHIQNVTTPSPLVIDVELSRADYHFDVLLAETVAKVLPYNSAEIEDFDRLPSGTGPYRVSVNDDKRLILEAYDSYFGFRPLVDRVEVWVIDEIHSSIVYPSLSQPNMPTQRTDDDVALDPGCTYISVNQRSGLGRDKQWQEYFASKLTTFNLFAQLSQESIVELGLLPAHGLKPGWYHSQPLRQLSPPQIETVSIAYHSEHPVFPTLSTAIASLLKQDGLAVQFIRYDHVPDDIDSVDLWIKPMGLGTHRDDTLLGWLLDYSNLDHLSTDNQFEHIHQVVQEWQGQPNAGFPARELGRYLVENQLIIPMFHCWLGVSKDHCGALQNAKCNALGWFDFSKVWVKLNQPNEIQRV